MFTKSYAFSLLACLVLALTASAAEIRGIIIKADAGTNELTVEGRGRGVRGKMITFRLDAKTDIRVGTQPGRVADLVSGKRVRISYELQGSDRVASRVE